MILARRAGFWLIASALLAACGASDDPVTEGRSDTALTVFLPPGPNAPNDFELPEGMTLDYEVRCGETPPDVAGAEGALDFVGSFVGTGPTPTAVFEGTVELERGPCVLALRLRDSMGQLICTMDEPVSAGPETVPDALQVTMGCFAFCPASPLPDELGGPKLSCGPIGALVLSLEIPADVQGVAGARFFMEESGDRFLEGAPPPTYEGAFERIGAGTTDLGAGPTATDVWEAIVRELGAAVPHRLELSVLDSEGATLCSAERLVEVAPGGIAHVHVVLSCR